MQQSEKRCGIVAIIGEPNVGKSTLLNRLVGEKISIVTPKVQTTRFNIRGVCVHNESQLVFVDTPGIFSAEKNFEKAMVKSAWTGIGDADVILLLLDATKFLRDSSLQIIDQLKAKTKQPVFLIINKIDATPKNKLLELATAGNECGNFAKIFMISALDGDGVGDVLSHIADIVPQHPWLYPAEQMSDISLRLLSAEITREKLFLRLEQELPYSIFVETESWEESDNFIKISQAILVQREGQKKIVIGNKGEMVKNIGIAARKELEKTLNKKIHLNLFVKVKPNWKDEGENYRTLGLEFRKS